MAETADLPAWIALLLGLYSFAAGLGEFRAPGGWEKMVAELRDSAALRFLTGFLLVAIGGLIYLASPWRPGDWLSVFVAVIAGWMVLEGMLFLAFGKPFVRMASAMMRFTGRGWALVALVTGFALVLVALLRL